MHRYAIWKLLQMVSSWREGTTEKKIKKLYPEETYYISKKDQNSEPMMQKL